MILIWLVTPSGELARAIRFRRELLPAERGSHGVQHRHAASSLGRGRIGQFEIDAPTRGGFAAVTFQVSAPRTWGVRYVFDR